MKIQLLLTGSELMSGHTVDTNSAMIADALATKAYSIHRKVTVGDEIAVLLNEMKQLSNDSDVLIVNGGLGPTIDDLTAEVLSQLSGQPLEINQSAKEHLTVWCERRKIPLNESNLKQALLPKGVEVVPNPVGSAVGFSLNVNNCLIICTPGVPSELKQMLDQSIVAQIYQQFPSEDEISTLRFQTFGIGESNLQQLITTEFSSWPEDVELGFRAGLPLLEVKLTIKNAKHQPLQQQCFQQLKNLIGDYIVGENNTTLAESVIQRLQQNQQTLTTAESCTGGLIASLITEVAGASNVFEAGIVSYSNRIKHQLLNVSDTLLDEHGAVSEPVVQAMAQGAISCSNADYAIAVSGIAGPDGGSEEKPVGTVWMAIGEKNNLKTHCLQFNASRKWFQQMVAATTLDLIRRELQGITRPPRYLKDKRAK